MNRRQFLIGLGAVSASPALLSNILAGSARVTEKDIVAMRENWRDLLPEDATVNLELTMPDQSEEYWRERLSAAAFDVLREEGTERSGTHPYNWEKREGVFVCAGCELPLFTSAMKYESGTGWPSFFTHIPNHMGTKRDYKLIWPRTEYHCVRCGGHQGHVFNDGPPPTGQRWCNNGVALKFLAKA